MVKPMLRPLPGVLLFLPVALAMIDAAEGFEARRYAPPAVRHAETHWTAGTPLLIDPAIVDQPSGPLKIPNAALEPLSWGDLDGWTRDDHARAFATFYASCRPITRASLLRTESARVEPTRARYIQPHFKGDASKRSTRALSPGSPPVPGLLRAALEQVCAQAVKTGPLDQESARQFFEANFVPVRIRKLGDSAGFLTGYYEPIVEGSRFPTREFAVPLYRRPTDLVAPGVASGASFPNVGRAFRQTPTGELVPYYDRGEIEDGALDGQHLEICWLRSAADALSVQIEGSARVRLEDGTLLRLSYDAHNGYPFVPVGRALTERHLVPREEQRIREWMHDNPEAAKMVRRQNRQVVFFRVVGLNDDREALGAQGIPLTAGRSIAVDKALHAYGTPFFIEADLPLTSPGGQSPFRRLMIAQDTGSAIVGPARADLFFGAGEEAGQIAGRIQQSGRVAMFVPRELGSLVTVASVPLPRAKPGPSLASYAFRPVTPPRAKPEPLRGAASTLRSAQQPTAGTPLRPGVSPAKPEPPRIAERTFYSGGPQAKTAQSQFVARGLRAEAPSPLTRPGQSQPVTTPATTPPATTPPTITPPTIAKNEPSQISNRALRLGALPSAKPRFAQPASLVGYDSATRTKTQFARPDGVGSDPRDRGRGGNWHRRQKS
jgi:membrane-bound lytic murein transglycosylase A